MRLLRYKDSTEHRVGQTDLLLHSHMYLHLILQDAIHLGCTRKAACMSLQAQVDWKSRGFVLLYCAIANVKQESLQLEQIVAGVSAEVTDCSQLWTHLVLILVGVTSVIITQHSSICMNFHAVYIPIETSNPVAGERAWLGFLWPQTFKYNIEESMKKS